MSDVVVTVPKTFTYEGAPGAKGLLAWLAEGDAPGETATGHQWYFFTYGPIVMCAPLDRCYVVCEGRLVGYSPLVRVDYDQSRCRNGCAPLRLVRRGDAVAVTIPEAIQGFRGWRHPWWRREDEVPLDLSTEIAAAKQFRRLVPS